MRDQRLVVISGMSGSGKSLAVKCFEDAGYFCVDNLPVALIPPFCELIQRSGEQLPMAALVVDARERSFLEQFPEILRGLRRLEIPVEILFFDCSDEVLQRRFSETRRPHPMAQPSGTVEQAIRAERVALTGVRELSDRIIDTSAYTSHQLRAFLRAAYGSLPDNSGPTLNIESFGFKYGAPAQADLLFDVRFLPNPYFVDGLRTLDGRSREVQSYLDASELTEQFMARLTEFLDFLVPLYRAEGKSYLTVAIGCTGGKHRSVALAERLGEHFTATGFVATVSHRDLGKE